MSVFAHDHLIHDVLVAGACGFLSKNIKAGLLFQAIKKVALGKLVLLRGDQFVAIDFSERKLMQLKNSLNRQAGRISEIICFTGFNLQRNCRLYAY